MRTALLWLLAVVGLGFAFYFYRESEMLRLQEQFESYRSLPSREEGYAALRSRLDATQRQYDLWLARWRHIYFALGSLATAVTCAGLAIVYRNSTPTDDSSKPAPVVIGPPKHDPAPPEIPTHLPPWRCIGAFVRHEYARCIEEAKRSLQGSIKPVELFLLLISLQRTGQHAEAADFAPQVFEALRDVPFEQSIVRLIMGEISSQALSSQANTPTERWQAVFYSGACAITAGNTSDAQKHAQEFLALLSAEEPAGCYEFILAPGEFKPYVSSKNLDARVG